MNVFSLSSGTSRFAFLGAWSKCAAPSGRGVGRASWSWVCPFVAGGTNTEVDAAPALSSRFFCFCLFNRAELLVVAFEELAGSSSDALLSSFASILGPAGDFAFAAIVTNGRPAEGDLAQRS